MTIKKQSNDFARFEWKKSISTDIGNVDSWLMSGRELTPHEIESWFRGVMVRLVTCAEYGKVYGAMRGEPAYSGTRIHNMADNIYVNRVRNMKSRELLNKFVINGIMFILMTKEEAKVYSEITGDRQKAYVDAGFRKYLMSHPKTKEANDRVEKERKEAVLQWKAEAEVGKSGYDLAYHGADWDYFFLNVFPTWENKVAADTVGMWGQAAGYYARSDERAVKKVRRSVKELWSEYRKWCVGAKYVPMYVKQFSIRMTELGYLRRNGQGVRAFDVFVGEAVDSAKWEQERAEREAAAKERMRQMRAERTTPVPDSEFLVGLSGRYMAAELWDLYMDFCRKHGQQLSYGKRQFYGWLSDNGFRRETKSGCLFMEKK